ncbi:MAG: signal peptidase II [Fibrobacterota bacterium]
MKENKKKWLLFGILALSAFLLDIITKQIALKNIPPSAEIPVLGDWFSWTLVYNPGALWSIDPSRLIPFLPSHLFFLIFGALALIILLRFVQHLNRTDHPWMFFGCASVAGGALGNLLDRIIQEKGVVDFIKVDFGFPPFDPWPIFNAADIFLSVGIGMIILGTILGEDKENTPPEADK